MTRQEHLLTILCEECVETAQRATKAIRFGLEEIQPGQDLNNAQRIIYEFNDLMAVMQMLQEEGYFKGLPIFDEQMQALKKEKVNKYYKYSQNLTHETAEQP